MGVREVAAEAGVSLGTVSNVLNNPDRVGLETRERVEAAMRAGAPIVPVTIDRAHEIWPVGQLLPRPFGRIRVVFHPAIPVEQADGRDLADLRHRARELADAARDAVASELPASRVGPAHGHAPEPLTE